ncbi:MAG: hypothetical protein Fur0018_09510 [Anaerolineales bacterium]
MSLWHNLKTKLIVTVVLAVVVFFLTGAIGFPMVFRWFLTGYVFLALPFFVLLDARFTTEAPKRPGLAILVTFVIGSVVLQVAGSVLPQYSTMAERQKIARIQEGYLERQQAAQLEELKALAEAQGLAVIPQEQVGMTAEEIAAANQEQAAATESSAPDPALIERGKTAYQDWECYNCHKLGGQGGVKRRGPELDSVGLLMSPDALRAKMINPQSSLSVGFEKEYNEVTMPDDLGDRMSPSELDAIVAYMRSLTSDTIQSPAVRFPGKAGDKGEGPFYEIPLDYQKFMPEGWWTDESVIAAGKEIYSGAFDSAIVCAACHGADGKPVLTGAADFTDLDYWESMSEPYMYWRIAAGIEGTPMTPFGGKLTEEQIWQVLAYINTLAYGDVEPHFLYPPEAVAP